MVDVAAPFLRAAAGTGALLRHRRRALHPVGLVLDGVLEVDAAVPPILDAGPLSRSGRLPVLARLSKALGTPGPLPDVLGWPSPRCGRSCSRRPSPGRGGASAGCG